MLYLYKRKRNGGNLMNKVIDRTISGLNLACKYISIGNAEKAYFIDNGEGNAVIKRWYVSEIHEDNKQNNVPDDILDVYNAIRTLDLLCYVNIVSVNDKLYIEVWRDIEAYMSSYGELDGPDVYEKFVEPESLKLYVSPLFKNTTLVFDKNSGNLGVSFFIPIAENISAIKTNIDKCLDIEECKARLKCM